ncbi:MAG: IS110 family transposase [Nevskiales bacterium]
MRVSVTNINLIKLGLDVHADSVRVVRQLDHATPQPAQKFKPEQFLDWATKQVKLAAKVYSCYEAGPFGYGLHRQLTALGIENVVIRPQNWDELGKGVKTDKTDALALCQRLDRYVQGNHKALAVVRVPTPAEEAARWPSRQREQMLRERKRLEAQGRSLLLTQGLRVQGPWWQDKNWKPLLALLPAALAATLEITREVVKLVHEKVEALTVQLEAAATPSRAKGVGALTTEVRRREMGDWKRFSNRRQVASYTGWCPSVYASGRRMVSGSITKHGNPRVRAALIELAWRLVNWQPHYPPVAKWRAVLLNKKTPSAQKKKAIVAIGRHLAIDLWRLATGRCRAEDLQLVVAV